jgi:hypothetical protein
MKRSHIWFALTVLTILAGWQTGIRGPLEWYWLPSTLILGLVATVLLFVGLFTARAEERAFWRSLRG